LARFANSSPQGFVNGIKAARPHVRSARRRISSDGS
jgi:hypothetical protein